MELWEKIVLGAIGLLICYILFAPNNIPLTKRNTGDYDYKSVVSEINEIENININDNFPDIEEIHWVRNSLTYKIENENECNIEVKERIESAFKTIQSETGNFISFKKTNGTANISVFCKEYFSESLYGLLGDPSSYSVLYGEGMPVLYENNGNLIKKATINFYGAGLVCGTGYPALEVHEILHTFGFAHNYGLVDVMSPEVEVTSMDCRIKDIDRKYISCLKNIYSNGEKEGDCTNINFLTLCEEEYVLGSDNKCHEECGDGYYCLEGYCVNEECSWCPEGEYLGTDDLCYPEL